MTQDKEILIINNVENLLTKFKINEIPELLQENLEQIIPKEKIQEKNDCILSNIKLIENYIILISTKTSKNLSEMNSLQIIGFEISIIKLDLNPGEERFKINISIPLKEPKVITNKNSLLQKYFFFDFIKVSENKNYFHICVFDQLHIYKIYIKDNQLKYNKIELKKFNEKTKVLYLGECFHKNENLLEIDLLLKPMNNLMILKINTDEKSQKVEEKIYEFKNIKNNKYNNKNIFHRFFRSFCGKFLFTEKETDKKFLISRENDDMVIEPVSLEYLEKNDTNSSNNSYINFLYEIENDLFLLTELPKENEEEDEYIILGIFNLIFNNEKEIYESKLIQKILIKNEGKNNEYFININIDKDISIQIGDILIYIQLGKNSSVEKIFKLNTNAKELQISRFFCAKYGQWFMLLSFINDNIYISKLLNDNCNDIEKNCIINYVDENKQILNENIIKENNDKNAIEEKFDLNNNEKEKIQNEKYSSEVLQGIISKLNNHIDEIINDRIEQNKEKFEPIKQEFENKFELIEQDILAQKKENEKLEKRLDEILNRIGELDDANKENIIFNENNINNDINNLKNLNEMFKTRNSFPKADMNNILPLMRRLNSMKMMFPFNFTGAENLFNNQMAMNDPRINQFFNNGFISQGNYFFKK